MNLNTMLEDHIPAALCFQLLLDAFNIATTTLLHYTSD